jgi:hypothetical protein
MDVLPRIQTLDGVSVPERHADRIVTEMHHPAISVATPPVKPRVP